MLHSAIGSYRQSLESIETVMSAYALLNRIRLFSSDAVLAAAEQTLQDISDKYFSGSLIPGQLYELASLGKADLVRSFSEACWQELKTLRIRA
jgi:hypothetical protein